MEKYLSKFTPTIIKRVTLSPGSENLQKAISAQMCVLTEMKISELGLIGSAVWMDKKTGAKLIISKFKRSKIMTTESKGFGTKVVINEAIKKLEGFFYVGKLDSYIYEVNEKTDTVIIKWHPDILLSYLVNTSLLDPEFKITYQSIKKNRKNSYDDKDLVIINIETSNDCNPYSKEEIPTYFKRLIGK